MTQSIKQLKKDLCWDDLSIQPYQDQSQILVLICDDDDHRLGLYKILNTFQYSFVFSIEPDKTYEFHLQFLNLEYQKSFKTGLTEARYPALKFLRQGLVKYISAGGWNHNRTACEHYDPIPFFSTQRASIANKTNL
ncbi:MAG: hypothetical protein V4725_13105 [Bacteroidota bacterium]|nr:hypothetical protein [Ferruginibacter sp.]